MFKRQIEVYVYSKEGSIYENWEEFKSTVDDAVSKVPEEFRASVRVEIETYPVYGDYTSNFQVFYTRPETEEERNEYLEKIKRKVEERARIAVEAARKLGVNI